MVPEADRPFPRPDAPWAQVDVARTLPPSAVVELVEVQARADLARTKLDAAERQVAILSGRLDARIPEVAQARAAIQQAHALLFQLVRRLTDGEVDPSAIAALPPFSISTDYVAWVLGDQRVDHFTAELLRLIAKADPGNRARLRRGFPNVVQAYEWWMVAGEAEEGGDGE